MESKEREGKFEGGGTNSGAGEGGLVEMHVMERKPAWAQFTHLSLCGLWLKRTSLAASPTMPF